MVTLAALSTHVHGMPSMVRHSDHESWLSMHRDLEFGGSKFKHHLKFGWCSVHHGFLSTSTGWQRWWFGAFECSRTRQLLLNSGRNDTALGAHVHLLGCARDVGAKLHHKMIPQIRAMGRQFASHSVLLFEDGSGDNTRQVILDWTQRSRGRVNAIFAAPNTVRVRTERLSRCRNTIIRETLRVKPRQLSQIGHRGLTAEQEYIVMLDLDCKRDTPPVRLQMAVSAMVADGWSVLGANSMAGSDYYDLWALRSRDLHIDYDCWHDRVTMRRRGNCDSYQVQINESAPIIAVNSAFNGLAIYSTSALRYASRCSYAGTRTCEHVAFHSCLRRYGLRIGIAPFLIQGCGDGAPRSKVGPPTVQVRVGMDGRINVRPGPGATRRGDSMQNK